MIRAERIAAAAGSEVIAGTRLAGGSLGGATRLELADGRTIVAKQGPSVVTEAEMLRAIADTGARAPGVLHAADDLLLMDFVAGGRPDAAGWMDLAAQLALLHVPRNRGYGWAHDHAFAEVAIPGGLSDNWAQFWAEKRLACHFDHIAPALARRVEALAARTADWLPSAPPAALLHGDLWGGNLIFAERRLAAFIDPACCYGDREVDVAMLSWIDHPPAECIEALALDADWRERRPLYTLWPMLVHLRLFGNAYRPSVERALLACGV